MLYHNQCLNVLNLTCSCWKSWRSRALALKFTSMM